MVRTSKIFYGWWIVLAGSLVNIIAGGTLIYGFTVFFNPIRETFGWGAAVTAIAFSIRGLETGFLDPLVGFLVDKVGPKKLMIPGWGVAGLAAILMSRVDSLWQFYGAFLLLAAGMGFGSFVVINTAVAHWFVKKRSRAMSLMYVGFGASGLLAPLLALAINEYGWRTSLVIVGVAYWVLCIPLSLLMAHKPSQYGYLPDGEAANIIEETTNGPSHHLSGATVAVDPTIPEFSAKEALKTSTFWLLSSVFLFQHIATSAVMVHIVPYLESVKIPATVAASAVTGMTLFSLVGRLGFGFLGDFFNKRYIIAIALGIQAVGVLLFSLIDSSRLWLIIPALLTYGAGFGGPIPLRPALQADYFGTKSSVPSWDGWRLSVCLAG